MLDVLKTRLDSQLHSMRRFLRGPDPVTPEGDRVPGRAESARREEERRAVRRAERPMRHALHDLLEQHPSSRLLMRHLDLIERALRTHGMDGVQRLPTRILAKALQELETLVWDWSCAPLAELRSKLAVRVKTPMVDAAREEPDTSALGLDMIGATDVTEVDHTVFDEMARGWSPTQPLAAGVVV